MIAFLATNQHRPPIQFEPIDHFPAQHDFLSWCQDMGVGTAVLFLLVGAIYLLYGWSMFKPLIMLNAAVVGGYVGMMVAQRADRPDYILLGGFLGAIAAAAASWPLMKWAVAVIGGICGAAVGAYAWHTAGHDPKLAWAGAMTGLVGFGMLSFILFRGSIIMYTSLQGALMVVLGLVGLGLKYDDIAPTIARNVSTQPLMLPIAVLIPCILGLIYQQTHSPGGGGGGPSPKPAEKK